jgi:uncharacterized membrane protein YagU involved in acid resistance
MDCAVYMNGFGPERGFHLESCKHICHPIYLINLMVTRRRCAVYKVPFHEHLYELFGLITYMSISLEYNLQNTPDLSKRWDNNLVWNWQFTSSLRAI